MARAERIRAYLLKEILQHPHDIVAKAAHRFSVTRTTIHRHISTLINQGLIFKSGTTRQISYQLTANKNKLLNFNINNSTDEFIIYDKYFKADFDKLPENIESILYYGITEVVNNVIDHANATTMKISTITEKGNVTIIISDNGVGIFNKVSKSLGEKDKREALLQLSKGKYTTDPKNHTGEGIFFSSRLFDIFEIISNGLHLIRDNQLDDWSFTESLKKHKGTKIQMTLNTSSSTDIVEIFKKYQDPETLSFDRTEVVVALSDFDQSKLISRSQAKRVLRNLDKFHHVILDFAKISLVGQGFVDQIFRVYANEHPDIQFSYINANKNIDFMIQRGIATGSGAM